jgi:hypothetical protein
MDLLRSAQVEVEVVSWVEAMLAAMAVAERVIQMVRVRREPQIQAVEVAVHETLAVEVEVLAVLASSLFVTLDRNEEQAGQLLPVADIPYTPLHLQGLIQHESFCKSC